MTSQEKKQLNDAFVKAFPLESLPSMTIEQYTNLNRSDSFCYWLENKATELGSVSGGSSYKFGIFRYDNKPKGEMTNRMCDDKYAWYLSLGNTAEEAFNKIRDAISQIAKFGREGNLDAIESIDALGPIIKWKIAFIYSNETLIPYYSLDRLKVIAKSLGMEISSNTTIADIQKFLIARRNGKNVHEYGGELHGIWVKYEAEHKPGPKVWMWKGNESTFGQNRISMGGNVSEKMRDYGQYTDYKSMKDDYQKAYGNTDVSIPDAYWKFMKNVSIGDIVVVFDNVRVSKENYHRIYGWGLFSSELINDKTSDTPLQRTVSWKKCLENPITSGIVKNSIFFHSTTDKQALQIKQLLGIEPLDQQSSQKTNTNLMKYQTYIDLLKANYNLVLTGAPGTGKTYMAQAIAKEMGAETEFVQFHPSYDYTDFVEGLRPVENGDGTMGFERKDGIFKEFCKKALKNLEDSKKSVEVLSKELTWEEKLEELINDAIDNGTELSLVTHKKFQITDVSETKLTITNNNNEKSKLVSVSKKEILKLLNDNVELQNVGDIRDFFDRKVRIQPDSYVFAIVKKLREQKDKKEQKEINATKVERKDFVFIIDEINRGEASKIFGELFYAIDPGYRGKNEITVKTQYQNIIPESDEFAKGFYVPENVYILATMNDIDRSVESMDFAMRRRFTWQEVTPEDTKEMLDSLGEPLASKAKSTMMRLNVVIAETDGLGSAFTIGPSYYLKLGRNGGDFDKLWDLNLEPLLKEYLRGFRKAKDILDTFKKAYKTSTPVESKEEIIENED